MPMEYMNEEARRRATGDKSAPCSSHCSSAGNIVDKVPEQFVCFSSLGRLPRMFRKLEHGSYDAFVWSEGKWQFHDNVGEDTAREWHKHSESDVYVR